MELQKIKIGSHVSMKGKDMFLNSAREAASYDADIFMAYTGAPQNSKRKPVEELKVEEGWAYMEAHGLSQVIIHAPYLINLANTVKDEIFRSSVEFLDSEIRRAEALRSPVMILHPGSHVGAGSEAGIRQLCEGLNQVIRPDMKLVIALETMAGKGGEIGTRFEELEKIISCLNHPEKVKVCFDTCHVHDSGYDLVNSADQVLKEFETVVGKNMIAVFHMNDSKNERGSAKDRHENYGFGKIGFEALQHIMYHPDYLDVPKILESPWVKSEDGKKEFPPYKEEIISIRTNCFDPMMVEKLRTGNNTIYS